jgi:uncharacterized membrane protein YgaE (UPF0421/DUF939 family)
MIGLVALKAGDGKSMDQIFDWILAIVLGAMYATLAVMIWGD